MTTAAAHAFLRVVPPTTSSLQEPTLPDRLALILTALCGTVAEKLLRRPWLNPLVVLLYRQLRRKIDRFAALHAQFLAGTLRPPRPRAPRPPRAERPPRPRLPSGTWLPRLVQEAAVYRSQLEHLLTHDAELVPLLAATPRAGRLLRPLCRMLAIDLPPNLRLPPTPKPAPAGEAAPPDPAAPANRPHTVRPRPASRAPSRAAELRQLFPGYKLSPRR